MNYIKDEQGQIMVRDSQGNTKWLHQNVIDNTRLLKRMGFTIVEKPAVLEVKTPDDHKKKAS